MNRDLLREIAEGHGNVTQVRQRLGLKSVEWMIETKVLESNGYVMKMGKNVKMMIRWWEEQEGRFEEVRWLCERGRWSCI